MQADDQADQAAEDDKFDFSDCIVHQARERGSERDMYIYIYIHNKYLLNIYIYIYTYI